MNYRKHTQTKISSFWWNFCHWLHQKLSSWQFAEPVTNILFIKMKHAKGNIGSFFFFFLLQKLILTINVKIPISHLNHSCKFENITIRLMILIFCYLQHLQSFHIVILCELKSWKHEHLTNLIYGNWTEIMKTWTFDKSNSWKIEPHQRENLHITNIILNIVFTKPF